MATSDRCDSCGFLPPLPTGTDSLSYLIEILTKADALRGRTATRLVFPMRAWEYDQYQKEMWAGGTMYTINPPPEGYEGKRGMWLVGVWVERVDS
jgi:hypothetical protein